MALMLNINKDNPQPRLIQKVVSILNQQGVVIYPTDSFYAIGCLATSQQALKRISLIKKFAKNHKYTLICHDLSLIGKLTLLSNTNFRKLKSMIPGPNTFILPASKTVPKYLICKRKTIGIRVPNMNIVQQILEQISLPLFSTSLIPTDISKTNNYLYYNDPNLFVDYYDSLVDCIVDAGPCPAKPTTIIDLTGDFPKVIDR